MVTPLISPSLREIKSSQIMAIPLRSPRFTDPKCAARFQKALNNTPTIKKHETEQLVVRRLQQALIDVGHPLPKSTAKFSTPDGDFGNETFEAVRAFQRRYWPTETPDGKVGKNTLSKLDDLLPLAGAPLPPLPVTDDMDEICKQAVLDVLRGTFVSKVDFVYLGQEVNFGWFWWVKQNVDADKIKVRYDPIVADTGLAVYVPEDNAAIAPNTIVMPNAKIVTWKQRSVLIHESVHASQDLRGRPLAATVSEGAAYVAQNLYHRLATGGRVHDTSGPADAIHIEADKFAVRALAGDKTFLEAEATALHQKITNAGYVGSVRFDGVPGAV